MRRTTRVLLSVLVLLISVVLGGLTAVGVGRLVPVYEVEPSFKEATPVNIVVWLGVFVMAASLSAVIGLHYVWTGHRN